MFLWWFHAKLLGRIGKKTRPGQVWVYWRLFFFFFQWKIKSIKINDNNNNFFFSLPVIQKKSLVLISMKNTDRNCTDIDYSPGASMWS